MTRPSPTLTSILLRSVSGEALCGGLDAQLLLIRGDTSTPIAALGFLARVRMWLKLFFGGDTNGKHSSTYGFSAPQTRHQRRTFAHRQARRDTACKPPAHDLEMLMRFSPGSAEGLTLNQYRERFTRLSVMGRFQIYSWFFHNQEFCQLGIIKRFNSIGGLSQENHDLCKAPLRPD